MTAGPLRWTVATVAEATGGVVVGAESPPVYSVTTDSRAVTAGAVFVARRGDHHDGHDFAPAALAGGAAAVVVEVGRGAGLAPRVEVGDPQQALLDLASWRRAELAQPVVAITGSTGKTTTKDLLGAALGPGTWASPRSYNNEVGLPLAVLGAPDDAPFLVLEVGSRGAGHIAWLMPAVVPDVAVITNVGLVHLETFGSPEAIVAGKWELVAALSADGVAVLPAGDPRLLRRRHPGRRVTFGPEAAADIHIARVELTPAGEPIVDLQTPSGAARLHLAVVGVHQALNAAAATAAALALGEPLDDIARRIQRAAASEWRMEVHRGRFTVVNDAYNANPDSMTAALRTVAAMPGRRMAVLGLMAELGSAAPEEHRRIGALAAELGFDPVIVVGRDVGFAAGAGSVAVAAPDGDAALEMTAAAVRDGDVVLVKGSRVAGLETLAARLTELAAADEVSR